MVAFGFLPHNLRGGGDLQMMVLLKNECSLSGGRHSTHFLSVSVSGSVNAPLDC